MIADVVVKNDWQEYVQNTSKLRDSFDSHAQASFVCTAAILLNSVFKKSFAYSSD